MTVNGKNRRRWAVAAIALALGTTACALPGAQAASSAAPAKPNIVFVLTDDLATNLVQYMPHVQALAKAGTSFSNYTVTDSLCCPSRSSVFSGKFPHDTGIYTNGGSDGGFGTFHARGEEKDTVATSLQAAGYRTGMMGKYLNGYQPASTLDGQANYVPPGWSEWDVAGNGYPEFNYNLNENHKVVHYGSQPKDYLTDVLSGKASDFINSSASAHSPFFLEVATFAPHAPYTPAPADANSFPGLKAPQGPAYDTLPSDPPAWLAGRAPLTAQEQQNINADFRKRVQAVQAVDRMLASIEHTLSTAGVAGDTDVVFSSDNGYHMGEYRLNPGKMTAFDTDVNVPLVVSGPGVPAGRTVGAPVENIDLRPTFADLAGANTPTDVDGHTLKPLLANNNPTGWRTAGLIEHHGPDTDPSDPDFPAANSGNPTTYEALRTATYTYVEYSDGGKEYYDRRTDPSELHNTVKQLPAATLAALHKDLQAMTACHGQTACWQAAHVSS
ncbi:sulfatase family protein [Kutzneria sp. CA-103260]|uniref:sulfatase family protein n=1 Tax=Kutzneria sp. CA-103260 TaxID=2802641 RepID=UPI001BAE2E25|nr:sulfatase [Kutzneria sp. CA-103260]QUQ63808.1 sulfatase [Kutzneria sp. CA-103260]